MEITTRRQAAERGMNRYFTGKPCKHGHIAERYVTSNACVACVLASTMAHNQKIRDVLHKARQAREEGVAA